MAALFFCSERKAIEIGIAMPVYAEQANTVQLQHALLREVAAAIAVAAHRIAGRAERLTDDLRIPREIAQMDDGVHSAQQVLRHRQTHELPVRIGEQGNPHARAPSSSAFSASSERLRWLTAFFSSAESSAKDFCAGS